MLVILIVAMASACFGFVICAILAVGKQSDTDSELYYAAEQWRNICESLQDKGYQHVTPQLLYVLMPNITADVQFFTTINPVEDSEMP